MSHSRFLRWLCLMGLVMQLAACGAQPSENVVLGDVLKHEEFNSDFAWMRYANASQNVDFRVENGVYRAQAANGGFMWTIDADVHTNVSIQVDTQQLSSYRDNAYGLMCRASTSDNGDGYYFLISGDGYYTLRVGSTDRIRALIPWTQTSAIQQNQSINRIRIICVEDYLALYINGQFVAEARDTRFQRGYAGLVAGVPGSGEVDVTFDDLIIRSASLADAR